MPPRALRARRRGELHQPRDTLVKEASTSIPGEVRRLRVARTAVTPFATSRELRYVSVTLFFLGTDEREADWEVY